MMRKTIIGLLLAVSTVAELWAQEPGNDELNREVEVSKAYMPAVEKADKLGIEPTMTDTVALRPEFDYSIRPSAWVDGFNVVAINPVRMDMAGYDSPYPFYLKVGGGYPGRSLFDFYANSVKKGKFSWGGYLNHDARYGAIENNLDEKANAFRTNNSLGLFGKLRFGSLSLAAEAGYDYDVYTRYGRYRIDSLPLGGNELSDYGRKSRIGYSSPHASLLFGNDFTDLSYFNFRLGAEWYRFSDGLGTLNRTPLLLPSVDPTEMAYTDDYRNSENGLKAYIELGKAFSAHQLTLRASYEGYYGGDSLSGYRNRIITVGPRYALVTDKFKLGIGCDFVFDHREGVENRSWFFPQFHMTYDLASGYFVPYVDLTGTLHVNNFRNVARENPYLSSSMPDYLTLVLPRNTAEYALRAGISGSFSSAFSYRAYVGASLYRDVTFFANLYQPGRTAEFGFLYTGDELYSDKRMTVYMVGAELEGRVSGSFRIAAGAHYYGYDLKHLEHVSSRPNYDASLQLEYNSKEKFFLHAGAVLTGARYFFELIDPATGYDGGYVCVKQKAAVDVRLGMEYRMKGRVGIFVEGSNLAGSKLYYFNHYPERGPQVDAGIKVIF